MIVPINKESVLEKTRALGTVSGCAAYDCEEVESVILNEPEVDVVTPEDYERMKRELNTEIEGLKKANDIILARNFATNVCQETLIERAKAEAIKEFADLAIKAICEKVSAPTPTESYIVEKCIETIDNLEKNWWVIRNEMQTR